ncbi:MAG: hypothetical protein R3C03_10475 [Pirellulaceae bacterium]
MSQRVEMVVGFEIPNETRLNTTPRNAMLTEASMVWNDIRALIFSPFQFDDSIMAIQQMAERPKGDWSGCMYLGRLSTAVLKQG